MSEERARARTATVIVLAGGFGTRVRHLLPGRPKPMAPVEGRPFLEWVVRFYARHAFRKFVLSTGYLSEVIEAHFKDNPVSDVCVDCRPETTPLGTAGGCINCLPPETAPDSKWIVVNGDSLVFADPAPLVASLSDGNADAAVLGLRLPDATRYGTFDIGKTGMLAGFREKQPGAGVINTGVYAFTGEALRRMPTARPLSFEQDVFPGLARSGRVAVVTTDAAFLDIGTPESLAEAGRFIAENRSEFLA